MLKNLGKKDSYKVLLEEFETTLHRADGVISSPKGSSDYLLTLKDLEEDSYSRRKQTAGTSILPSQNR